MKVHKVTLKNFRGYINTTTIEFNDLTVFVGRNDIGKSTILEALDLFFNDGKGVIKYDDGDVNVASDLDTFSVGVSFSELPDNIVVDASFQTSLADEYLLNDEGEFEIIKRFNGKKCTGVFIRAYHPVNENCSNLHQKKNADLKKIIHENGIECENLSINSVMRQAIWGFFDAELQLANIEIDVTSGVDTKSIWEKVSSSLPMFSLFQADRQNSDKDTEVQDPLKLAVSQFLKEEKWQAILDDVAAHVEEKLREVSDRTLAKLREMDPNIADLIKPVISTTNVKWAKVFDGVSLCTDGDIPINKRGSGVKRLVLLNFFRAEAERRQEESDNTGIVYAIEEPETSQHFANQKIITDALIELSRVANTQVIMTTHSGVVVKRLNYSDLRLVFVDEKGDKRISRIQRGLLPYVSINEVNYIAFGEVTEEYHDELYGYIIDRKWLGDYENGKPRRRYIRKNNDGSIREETRTLIRYQKENYPSLDLSTKEDKNGWWTDFRTELGYVYINHKIREGHVDLTFPKASENADRAKIIADWARHHKLSDASVVKTKKSVMIRIHVPELDIEKGFDAVDIDELNKCFEAIKELTEFANMIEMANSIAFK